MRKKRPHFCLLSVADPAAGWGGGRYMKSMREPLAAIFSMTYFYRAGGEGAWPPRPPGSAIDYCKEADQFL